MVVCHGDQRDSRCSDIFTTSGLLSSSLTTMLLRGTLVHTPRLGDLEILDDYLIGLKYVHAIKAFSLL